MVLSVFIKLLALFDKVMTIQYALSGYYCEYVLICINERMGDVAEVYYCIL